MRHGANTNNGSIAMRRFLAVAVLILATVAVVHANGQWTPKNYAGQTMGTRSMPGDTTVMARAHIDTIRSAQGNVTGTLIVDTLTVSGIASLSKLSVTVLEVAQSDSSTVYGLDTTLTGAGASSCIALPYDERDPNRLGRYTETGTLTTDLPAAITDELAGSIWCDEGIAWPINGIIQVSVRGDSVTIRRGDNAAVALVFRPVAGGILTTTTPGITDVAYMDRTLHIVGVDSVGWTSVNLRTGVVRKVLASGVWQWNGALSERNSNKGWRFVSATPALLDARVNSIGVMRSPWSSPKDVLVTIGTLKGIGQFIYNAAGTLSVYDAVTTSPVRDVEVMPDGQVATTGRRNRSTSFATNAIDASSLSGNNILSATEAVDGMIYSDWQSVVSGTHYRVSFDLLSQTGTTQFRFGALDVNLATPRFTVSIASPGRYTYRYTADTTGTLYTGFRLTGVSAISVRNFSVSTGADSIFSYNSSLAITSDSKPPDAIFSHGRTGALAMPWDSTSSFNAIAALPGRSSAGRDGARVFVGADSGLVVQDQKPSDQAGGMRQVIRKSYVAPLAAYSSGVSATISGPVAMFSPASSAFLAGTFSTGGTGVAPTYAATNDGPLSHAWTFNGTTQFLAADGLLDSLANDVQGTIVLWVKLDDGQHSGVGTLVAIGDTDAYTRLILYSPATSGKLGMLCRVAGVAQWEATTDAIWPDGATAWTHIALTHNGVLPRMFVNGDSVSTTFTASGTLASWISACTDADNVRIGASNDNSGGNVNLFDGHQTGHQFYSRALSRTEVAALYKAGPPFIETPTPDTLLTTNRIQGMDSDWLSGRVLLLDSTHVELRHSSGALLDSFMCVPCGQLYSAKFKRTPSADSLNIVIAGATGIRVIGQNPKLTDYAAAEWPRREYYIGNREAIVDSSGSGHFWKLQDAIDAIAAVGAKVITVAAGTYSDPVTSVGNSVMIEGAGRRTVITNANSTTDEAMTVTGDSVIVRDLCLYTAPGGAGGSVDALLWSGARGIAENVRVVDADDDAAVITGRFFQASNLRIDDADDRGLSVEAGRALLTSPVFSSGGTSVVFTAAGDTSRVIGGDIAGDIHAASGAVKIAIIGTNYGTLSDVGSGVTEGSSNP